MLAGDTLCVPNNLYPAPNVSHCVFELHVEGSAFYAGQFFYWWIRQVR